MFLKFRQGIARWQKIVVTIGIVVLLGGFGGVLFGEFSPSVGFQGLVDRSLGSIGFSATGLGMLALSTPLITEFARRRPQGANVAREAGVVALNLACYGGAGFLALGALTAIGRAPVGALVIMAVCIAVIVLYRRHRKKHPQTYDVFGFGALILFMLVFGTLAAGLGAAWTGDALADAVTGPRVGTCTLIDVDEDRPTGRYAGLQAVELKAVLVTDDGELVQVVAKEQDRDDFERIVYGSDRIAYYPRTGVLAGEARTPSAH